MAKKKQSSPATKPNANVRGQSVNQVSNRPPRTRTSPLTFSPQSPRQEEFIKKIEKFTVTFGVGAPGTGKTFLAIACALKSLLANECAKIIITRPTVSSGPEIGYLPGTESEKMAPFLVPIFDAIYKLLPSALADDLIDSGRIEIASISFVRGRNFEQSYVIVDEAENLDPKSFYMLLTRVCDGSKIVFCGDSSQIDLKNKAESGLEDAVQKFEGKEHFAVTRFTIDDCRRSPMVKDVIRAYFPDIDAPRGPSRDNSLGIPAKEVTPAFNNECENCAVLCDGCEEIEE